MTINVIDLFSGVGGLSLGFVSEGFNILLANEIDEEISYAYKKNFPNVKIIIKDITKLDIYKTFTNLKGGVDGIIGGPPCQGFSQKGQRKSIFDKRNYLFLDFYRIVEYLRPKFFVIENVPNLLTTESGLFREEINNIFSKIGYLVTSDILNSSDYGIPQNRRRAIIIGNNQNIQLKMPPAINDSISVWDAISDLAFLESGEGEFKQDYKFKSNNKYQEKLRENSIFLYNHVATNHSLTTLERLSLIPPNGGKEYLPKNHLTKSIYSGTWTRIEKGKKSVTITTRFDTPSSGKFTHPYLNRAITVREAARIQSFPDGFIFYGTKSSQMKQVGNAVPPILARYIARSIKEELFWRKNET